WNYMKEFLSSSSFSLLYCPIADSEQSGKNFSPPSGGKRRMNFCLPIPAHDGWPLAGAPAPPPMPAYILRRLSW
ncbi:MAG: hypothetical protein LBI62_05310, partial [Candidatus Accumulibacter sp.]|nr:hypothetical protein [Accumulibacter sp.]